MQQRSYKLDGKSVSVVFSGDPCIRNVREVRREGKRIKLTDKMKEELVKILL